MIISKDTEQVIIGGLLGDSYLRKQEESFNPHLVIVHGPLQLEYLKFKYSFFERDALLTDRNIFSTVAHLKKTNKDYLQYKFYTKALPIFNSYHNDFYIKNRKTVTRHILNKLNPLGLAIWYMDDGSRNIKWYKRKDGLKSVKSRYIRFSTNGFNYEEHEIIKQYFQVVWDIEVGIHKNGNYFVIDLNATNATKLIEIVKPHIVPCLQYKIDLMYNVTHPLTEEERVIRMALGQPNSRFSKDDDIV